MKQFINRRCQNCMLTCSALFVCGHHLFLLVPQWPCALQKLLRKDHCSGGHFLRFRDHSYSLASKFEMDAVGHLENANVTFLTPVELYMDEALKIANLVPRIEHTVLWYHFFTIVCTSYSPECFLNAFYGTSHTMVPVKLVIHSFIHSSHTIHCHYTILIRLLFILIHYHYTIHCRLQLSESLSSLLLLSPLQFISA